MATFDEKMRSLSQQYSGSAQQRLATIFQQAAQDVRVRAAKLEEGVFKPVGAYAADLSQRKPILATFLAIFAILSALPVLSFLGFLVLSMAIIIGTCLSFAALCIGFILFFTSGLLLLALLFTLSTSVFFTVSILAFFIAYRLASHVRVSGVGPGVGGWIDETKGRFQAVPQGAKVPPVDGVNGTDLDGVARRLQ